MSHFTFLTPITLNFGHPPPPKKKKIWPKSVKFKGGYLSYQLSCTDAAYFVIHTYPSLNFVLNLQFSPSLSEWKLDHSQ